MYAVCIYSQITDENCSQENKMSDKSLTPEHQDFFERFKSFWAAPSGPRVAEIIRPDAIIHFTGNAAMSGTDYIDYMDGMLATFPGMTVTPLDCASNGDRLYIAWETSSVIHGKQRKFLGVDRFRIVDGMAVEEHIIFDSAVLQPEGRPGIDH
jgi:predicted SnoaL-like aldol condensation-catalyzing enzyme